MTRAIFGSVAALLLTFSAMDAQQPRDNRRPGETGVGVVTGVVRDAADGRPMRRARVRITSSELEFARTTISADDGTFTFEGLPTGRFTLHATKEGHVGMNFGASRPGRPGRTLALTAKTSAAHAEFRLPRGGVITGTVLNPEGDPATGVDVMALTSTYEAHLGERRVTQAPKAAVTTDDRGVYRIYGLAEGSYFVAAIPRGRMRGLIDGAYVMSQSEIRAALAEVRSGRTAPRPGYPAPAPPSPTVSAPAKAVTLTPIFYPGTALPARATAIDLRAGEVRSGLDFDLEYVPTSTLEGLVTVPPGTRVQLLIADVDRSTPIQTTRLVARAGDDGRFSFPRIAPGSYTISARAVPAGVRQEAAATSLWGETGVIVSGEDISGITVPLLPALTIAGHVVFESSGTPAPRGGQFRIPLSAVSVGGSGASPLPPVAIDGSQFSISGVIPGTYRFPSPPRGLRAPIGPWWLKSMVVNGKELLDTELTLRESTDAATITFTDRTTELSGAVVLGDDTPHDDLFVIVFSTNPEHWFHNSRRVAGLRLAEGGRYAVRNLPPGDYRIAVAAELAMNEWFDPELLRRLQSTSTVLTLREFETRRFDPVLKR